MQESSILKKRFQSKSKELKEILLSGKSHRKVYYKEWKPPKI